MFGTKTKWISIALNALKLTWSLDGEKLIHLSLGQSDVDLVIRKCWTWSLGQPQRESLVGDSVTFPSSPRQPHGPLGHGEQAVGDVHRVGGHQPWVPLGQSDVEWWHYIALLWQAQDVLVGQTDIVMVNLSNGIYFIEYLSLIDYQIFRESCTNPRNEYSNPGPCAHVLGTVRRCWSSAAFYTSNFQDLREAWTQTTSDWEIPTMGLCVIDRSKCHLQTLFAKIAASARIFPTITSQFTSIYLRHTISQ